ncbi:hypothetical protein ACJ8KY_14945, partial [Serratia sp. CY54781]|uniref:hypothetical protein n=1 Tax=Serratia sp. CY54781 TaxID=3383638 RepID=UPI003FA0C002
SNCCSIRGSSGWASKVIYMIKNKNAKLNYTGVIQYCEPPPRLVLINYRQHFVIKVIGFKFAAML